MSDPLAEVIAMLNLRAVLTKTVEGAGDWRVIRSDQGLSFYGVVLEGGCRLEIDQHEPQILRAGDFILIPAAYRFALTSLTPPPSPALETIPVQLAEGHFRLGALDKPAQMQALIGHCASGSTNASLLASLLPAFVVVRNQPRLATFVGLLKEEAQADRAGKSFVLARMVELLFIEAIRSSGTLATPGLMRGLSDPRGAQAIRLLHQAPARRWTVNALATANRIIVPVQAEYLPAKGLEQLLSTINKVKRQLNPKLQIDGILLTMVDNRTNFAKEIAALLRETYGSKIKVFGTEIPHSVRAKEISAEGKSIFAHDPGGKVAEAYKNLTQEVTKLEKQREKSRAGIGR